MSGQDESLGMSEEEYLAVQTQLTTVAIFVAGLELDAFTEAINHAEAVGPILDPSLWIRGGERLREIGRLAAAAREFQKAAIQFRENFLAIQEKEAARL